MSVMATAAITNGPALSSIASSVDSRDPSVSYTWVSWSAVCVVYAFAPVSSAIRAKTSEGAPTVALPPPVEVGTPEASDGG